MPQLPVDAVLRFLETLQDEICAALEAEEPDARFRRDEIPGERGGMARPRVLGEGRVIEKAAVNFSHTRGDALPPAATANRPHLAGKGFQAASVSLIVHPRNPYAPTSHANFRFFVAGDEIESGHRDVAQRAEVPPWWFGGGYDLTPYYGFEEDAVHWHRTAAEACAPFGSGLHRRLKRQCDAYFHLPHRGEPRGVGGIFFDDLNDGGFDACFALVRALANSYLPAYLPILRRRKDTPFGDRERAWQEVRRGRYVEFNLLHDRGTRYGLQSGGRVESILASLPPRVRWVYDQHPEAGSPEAELLERFLPPRDWLNP